MRNRALGQAGGAFVWGEHVRVAVFAEAAGLAGRQWVKPSPGGKLHDAGADGIADDGGAEACAAVIEQADDIAVTDVARCGIIRMECDGLPAMDLGFPAMTAMVQLRMQLC